MKPYTQFSYFFPPRAEAMAEWGDEVMGHWQTYADAVGQFKLNGNRNLVFVDPEHRISFYTRHKDDGVPRKQKYVIPDQMRQNILALAPKGHWTVFDTELLHFKTIFVKNTLYFFDLLVWESQHLIGETYASRYNILHSLMGDKYVPLIGSTDSQRGAILGQNDMFLAENIPVENWKAAWDSIQKIDFIEGLVLKRTGGISRLESGHAVKNNISWMCKLRKPTKNFRK